MEVCMEVYVEQNRLRNSLLIKRHTNRQDVRYTPIAEHTHSRIGTRSGVGGNNTNTRCARNTNVREGSPTGFGLVADRLRPLRLSPV